MAFPIVFIYNNEPTNKITKNVSDEKFTVTGTLRDESSIVDPEVIIDYDDPTPANYAYIEAFHRYYFVKEITAYRSFKDENNVQHNLWRVQMHTDVLKTFSQGILGSPCVVAKSSNKFNLYLNDNGYKLKQCDLVSVQRFPDGFDLSKSTFVLTLLGKRTQTPPI